MPLVSVAGYEADLASISATLAFVAILLWLARKQ